MPPMSPAVFQKEDNELVALLWGKPSSAETATETYLGVNNPDGTLRWVFGQAVTTPRFLTFYNATTWKARLIKWGIELAFVLRQQKQIASLQFGSDPSAAKGMIDILQHAIGFEEYSVFMGTIGSNRKVIIEYGIDHKTEFFIKIPVGKNALHLVENEYHQLTQIHDLGLAYWTVPTARLIRQNLPYACVVVSNITPKSAVPTLYALTEMHRMALRELQDKTASDEILSDTAFWKSILSNVQKTQITPPISPLHAQIQYLATLIQKVTCDLEATQTVRCSHAHADFTPWNLFVTPQKLHAYDWELSHQALPMAYDALHFIAQTGILVQRLSANELKQKMYNELLKYQNFSNTNATLYSQLYVLYTAAYYLPLYAQQAFPHTQITWLLDTWTQLLQSD